jgi:phenylacetate-coenzyme A ligase PaaK-like adenylate-forming protein
MTTNHIIKLIVYGDRCDRFFKIIDKIYGRFNAVLNFFGQRNFFFSKKMTDIVDGSVDEN